MNREVIVASPAHTITPYSLAMRYSGVVYERPGDEDHPLIQWWLSLCGQSLDAHDEIPWCSAFASGVAWECRLPRSKSLSARSWLEVGTPIPLSAATPGYCVVILNRGGSPSPTTAGPGHVGYFAGIEEQFVLLVGGNQGNKVCVSRFQIADILGVRTLL